MLAKFAAFIGAVKPVQGTSSRDIPAILGTGIQSSLGIGVGSGHKGLVAQTVANENIDMVI